MSQANINPASMKTMTRSKAKYSQLASSNESSSSTSSKGSAMVFVVSVEAVVSVEFEVLVQGVVVECEAVGQVFDFRDFRGKSAQRLDEAGVAVDLDVQVNHDAVVRRLVLGEFLKLILDLLQGETEVERVFLFLRIEAQRKLVALFHNVHHPLVLKVVIACDFVLCQRHLKVFATQVVPQGLKPFVEGFDRLVLGEKRHNDGPNRDDDG